MGEESTSVSELTSLTGNSDMTWFGARRAIHTFGYDNSERHGTTRHDTSGN